MSCDAIDARVLMAEQVRALAKFRLAGQRVSLTAATLRQLDRALAIAWICYC
jgi:hypothetical protein